MRERASPEWAETAFGSALLRVARGPQGHDRPDLLARLLHLTYASKKRNRINGPPALQNVLIFAQDAVAEAIF
jgi:hypothetical protein